MVCYINKHIPQYTILLCKIESLKKLPFLPKGDFPNRSFTHKTSGFLSKKCQILWDSASTRMDSLGCEMHSNCILCLYNYKLTLPAERHHHWGLSQENNLNSCSCSNCCSKQLWEVAIKNESDVTAGLQNPLAWINCVTELYNCNETAPPLAIIPILSYIMQLLELEIS